MKKFTTIFTLFALIMSMGIHAGAQERTLEIVKNGQVVFSSPASEIQYMTVVNRLPAPKNVRGSVANGKITITWDEVEGATSYNIYRSADGNNFSTLGNSTTTTYTDGSPKPGSNYYRVQAFGNDDAESLMSDVKSVLYEQYDNHEYVDLGLPSGLLWATCNVGANSPEDYGKYYAWGETTTKSSYTYNNSLTDGMTLNKLKSAGIIDSNNHLTKEYDVASKLWGGSWRMPTKEEIQEFFTNTTSILTTQEGVYGRKVTSKINGNSIFLPAAGYRRRQVYLRLYFRTSLLDVFAIRGL